MAGVTVKVLLDKLPGAEGRIRSRSGQISQQSAKRIADDARRRAPRDTGHLQDDSIEPIKTGPFTWVVVASTEDAEHDEYAHFVEYGTTAAPATPYLTPAAEAERPRYLDAMRKLAEDSF